MSIRRMSLGAGYRYLMSSVARADGSGQPGPPGDRTTYVAGEIVQCDLWFPGKVVPVAPKVLADPPVLTMVAAYSGFIMAVLLPSRTTGDLVADLVGSQRTVTFA